MEWRYVKPLLEDNSIAELESIIEYSFPQEFVQCITQNNGGRPNRQVFDTNVTKERMIKSFLSFNKDDKESVWKIIEGSKEELKINFVPFAIDNFGNLICFNKDNNGIVFLDHENANVEFIAPGFSQFLDSLYD